MKGRRWTECPRRGPLWYTQAGKICPAELMGLPREHFLDELATAYIQAVAAAAGATIAVSRRDYGVDGTLCPVIQVKKKGGSGFKFVPDGFSVDFQLKGTTLASLNGDFVVYSLNARTFDMIASRSAHATPLYLFLVCFNSDSDSWITVDKNVLSLHAKAYWWRQAATQKRNSSTVRIKIPDTSQLTARSLNDMLDASKSRFANQ